MKKTLTGICQWIGLPGATIILSCAALMWPIGCATNKQTGRSCCRDDCKKRSATLGENCVRCHNIRSPSNYSPAQWEVVMMHMRVRANLTPEEHKKILEFLKSGS